MILASPEPSKSAEKAWLQRVSEYGCVVTGDSGPLQLHHVVGRTYRKDGHHVGRWFVLPLRVDLHDVHSNNDRNVTHYPGRFTDAFGQQCDLFYSMCQDLMRGAALPFSDEVLGAIMATGK